MRKVELLPTRDGEASYDPVPGQIQSTNPWTSGWTAFCELSLVLHIQPVIWLESLPLTNIWNLRIHLFKEASGWGNSDLKGTVCVSINIFSWHESEDINEILNPSSPNGGCNNPPNSFALVLKNAQQRGKIARGIFKFILSLHFSEKILTLPATPGVG